MYCVQSFTETTSWGSKPNGILKNWKAFLYSPNFKQKVKNIYPQCSFEIPILNSIMAVTATKRQCFLSIFQHHGILSTEKGKNPKTATISFHESTVLHNLFWWLSFKTEKCSNSKETAVLHNTEKIEDRDQYCEPQTLISVRKVRFSFCLTLVQSIFLF